MPGSCGVKDGKYVLLTLDSEIGRALFEAFQSSKHDEAMTLAKAADIVRRQIFAVDLSREWQRASLPNVLWQLVQLIIGGSIREFLISPITVRLNIGGSQIIRYNLTKYQQPTSVTLQRHSLSNEPLWPIAVRLMVSMKTRKKSVTDQLACEGLSVNYQCVKKIQKVICKKLCNLYDQYEVVCPPGLFLLQVPLITVTITSTLASFQHPGMPIGKQVLSFDFKAEIDNSGPSKIPTSYSLMVPSKAGKPEPPNSTQSKRSKSAHINGSVDDAME